MLVVLPVYKRVLTLDPVLKSLFKAKFPDGEALRLLIVNNNPDMSEAFEQTVRSVFDECHAATSGWQLIMCHRAETLPPIENWYSAISEFAEDGECVILHGDDDLFLPWSLVRRFNALKETDADVLVSKSRGGCFFLEGCTKVFSPPIEELRKTDQNFLQLDWKDLPNWDTSFIGCLTYRFSKGYQQALERAYSWCDEQSWINETDRRLMIPCYLPAAVLATGGKLAALHDVCVLRGMQYEEYAKSHNSSSGWNSGFLMLLAYGVFNNSELSKRKELDPVRVRFLKQFSRWYLVCLRSNNVDKKLMHETMRKYNVKLSHLVLKDFFGMLKFTAHTWFSFRQISRVRNDMFAKSLNMDEFFEHMNSVSS